MRSIERCCAAPTGPGQCTHTKIVPLADSRPSHATQVVHTWVCAKPASPVHNNPRTRPQTRTAQLCSKPEHIQLPLPTAQHIWALLKVHTACIWTTCTSCRCMFSRDHLKTSRMPLQASSGRTHPESPLDHDTYIWPPGASRHHDSKHRVQHYVQGTALQRYVQGTTLSHQTHCNNPENH